MIVDGNYLDTAHPHPPNNMVHSNDLPPSYDAAVTTQVNAPGPYVPAGVTPGKDIKVDPELQQQNDLQSPGAGPVIPSMPPTTVYNYINPTTHQVVSSLLPPDHPQMVCLQQGHLPQTRYGFIGILAAVFWFPLGIGLCLLDRRIKCDRCGQHLESGLCD